MTRRIHAVPAVPAAPAVPAETAVIAVPVASRAPWVPEVSGARSRAAASTPREPECPCGIPGETHPGETHRSPEARARTLSGWVPTVLSLSRALLSPAVPCLIRRAPHVARGVLVVAALTDAVDGPLARRWGVASEAGARLDSYADVVLFLSMGSALLRTVSPRTRAVLLTVATPIGLARAWSLVAGRDLVAAETRHSTMNRLAGMAVSAGTGLALVGAPAVVLAPGAVLAVWGAVDELTVLRAATEGSSPGQSW